MILGGRYTRGRGGYRGGRSGNDQDNYDYYDYGNEGDFKEVEGKTYYPKGKRGGRGNYKEKTEEELLIEKQQREEEERIGRRRRFKEQLLHSWRGITENLKKVSIAGEINVLIVTQRPIVARTLAGILSKEKIREFDPIYKGSPVLCFESKFKDFIANIKITSADGPLYNINFSESWDLSKVDPKNLFTEETVKVPLSKTLCKHIQLVSRKTDVLVLWTDMSSEGENICFQIIDNVKSNLPSPNEDYIFRAKYSSLASKDVQETFDNLVHKWNEYESLYQDVLSTIDLKIENAFTIYQTKYLFEKYPVLESMTKAIVYDSCQSTALALWVERADKLAKFNPEQYFTINILIKQTRTGFKTFELKWKKNKMEDEKQVMALFKEIKQEKIATVIEVNQKTDILARPVGLNTTQVLKHASHSFGFSPFDTMKILENLYYSGLISYHKTKSTSYGSKFNFEEILTTHQLHSEWGKYALNLVDKGYSAPEPGEEVGDNLPIIPIKSVERGKLGPNEWKIYEYISKTFLASISKSAEVTWLEVAFKIGEEIFEYSLQHIVSKGFFNIAPWLNTIKDEELPTFKVMQEYVIDTKKVIDGKTVPFGYLTESELITQMEELGIGNNWMIPVHLKNIVEYDYVKVNKKKNRALVPTNIGNAIIKSLNEIDPDLTSPTIRASIEKSCALILYNEEDSKQVVTNVLKNFKNKYEYFVEHFDIVDKTFKNEVISKLNNQEEIITKIEVKGKKGKKEAVSFPEEMTSYEHCTIYDDQKEPVEKKDPQIRCRECHNGQLKEAPTRIAISSYVTLKCTQWKSIYKCFEEYDEFEILKTAWADCQGATIRVRYPAKDSPLPHHANQYSSCIFCDSELRRLVVFPESKDKPRFLESKADLKGKCINKYKQSFLIVLLQFYKLLTY